MTKFIGAVEVVRVNTGLQLGRITNVWCSSCGVCDGDLRESSGTCYTNWIAARDAVNTAGQGQVDLNSINRDPWGSPYLLDESEGDPSEASCVYDTISSAGPDGISGTSDDISFTIPFYSCR
ncbi:MAG TPA: hypothetical protein ENN92_00430 [candidate division WWE3 bacterium]|uniref:Uncharacterized protein n=1 Tax=candidate division WWE3 bacterium TaxID=2053526 RepID=A0A7C1DPF0_UNCKA|nr:hypothetical protein [candidate division WWE3 bacterium]